MSETTGAGQRADTGGPPIYPAGMDRAWPPQHYPPPAPLPPAPAARRRWPVFVGGVAIGAAIAAAITAALMAGTRDTATRTPVTITATATPPAPTTPAPLPAAEANRHTCNTWLSAGKMINDASTAQSVIPQGMTILDPAVRANPDWTAGVQKAGNLYGQAADTLAGDIAPGTSPMLAQTASTVVGALHALSTTTKAFDEASGNAYAVTKSAANAMDVLCERLAPR